MKQLDETTWVAPQIGPEDVADAARAGVRMILCNRPDGEREGQPTAAEVARWAADAGIGFRHIPVVAGGITQDAVEATGRALEEAGGPVLAYCLSGGRSAALWALATARSGRLEPAQILGIAKNAGYDLAGLADALAGLAPGPRR